MGKFDNYENDANNEMDALFRPSLREKTAHKKTKESAKKIARTFLFEPAMDDELNRFVVEKKFNGSPYTTKTEVIHIALREYFDRNK